MKKILSIVLAVIMLLTPVSVFAADFDLFHKTDASKNYTFDEFLEDKGGAYDAVADHLTDYVIEYQGKYYNADAINAYLLANPGKGLKDAVLSGIADVPKPTPAPGDLTVIEISAISETQLLVDFSEAVSSALNASNFEVSVGGAAKTVTNVDVQDKAVFVTVSDVKFGDEVQVVVKNVSNADGSKTLASVTKTLKVGDAKDLYELYLEADDQGLLADGASTTMITAKLRNKTTKEVKALQGELQFITTKGQVAQTKVALKDGKATVNLQSEASAVEITAYVTATIISVPGNAYYEGLRSIELPVKFVTDLADIPENQLLTLNGGEARQADRIFLTMSDEIKEKMLQAIKKNLTAFEVDGQTNVVKDVQAQGKVLTLILNVDNQFAALPLPATKTPILAIGQPGFALKDNVEHIVKIPAGIADAILPSADGKKFVFTDNNFPTLFNVTYESDKRFIRAHFKEAMAEDHAEELEKVVINGNDYFINRHFLINNRPLLVTGKPVATAEEALAAKDGGFVLVSRVYVSTDDKNRGNEEGYIVKDQKDTRHIVTIELDRKSEPVHKPGTYALQVAKVGDWAGLTDPQNVIQTQTMAFETTGDTTILDASVVVQSPEQFLITFTQDITSTKKVEDLFRLSKDVFPGTKWLKYGDGVDEDYIVSVLPDPEKVNPNEPTKEYFKSGTKLAKGAAVSGKYFLLELTRDWQVIYDTDATGDNYFKATTNPHALSIDEVEDGFGKKMKKNFSVETPLDGTSPKVSYAKEEGASVFIVMTEPVKVNAAGVTVTEGLTKSQEQAKGTGVPPLAVEFVHKTTNESVIGKADALYEDDYAFTVIPENPLSEGKWLVLVRSLSDDIGNTVETTPYEVEITKPVLPPSVTAPKIEWIAFDNSDKGDVDPTHFDRIYVKFSEKMYVGPEANSVGRTENWSINNQPLDKETRVEVGIKGVTNTNDGITINMPVRQWDGVDGKNKDFAMVLNMASNFKSEGGQKLQAPYNGKFEVPLVDTFTDLASTPDSLQDHDMVFEAVFANPSLFSGMITKARINDVGNDGVVELIDQVVLTGALPDGAIVTLSNGGEYKWDEANTKFDLQTPPADVEINTAPNVLPFEEIPYSVGGTPKGKILNVTVPEDKADPIVKSAMLSDDKKTLTVTASEVVTGVGGAAFADADFAKVLSGGATIAIKPNQKDVDTILFETTANEDKIEDTDTIAFVAGAARDAALNVSPAGKTKPIDNGKYNGAAIFGVNMVAVAGAAPTAATETIKVNAKPTVAGGKFKIGNKTIGIKMVAGDPDVDGADHHIVMSTIAADRDFADAVETWIATAGGDITKPAAAVPGDVNISLEATTPGLAGNDLEVSFEAPAGDATNLDDSTATSIVGATTKLKGGTENKETSELQVTAKPTKKGRAKLVVNYTNNPDNDMVAIFAFAANEDEKVIAKRIYDLLVARNAEWNVAGNRWVVVYDEANAKVLLQRDKAEVVPGAQKVQTLTLEFY